MISSERIAPPPLYAPAPKEARPKHRPKRPHRTPPKSVEIRSSTDTTCTLTYPDGNPLGLTVICTEATEENSRVLNLTLPQGTDDPHALAFVVGDHVVISVVGTYPTRAESACNTGNLSTDTSIKTACLESFNPQFPTKVAINGASVPIKLIRNGQAGIFRIVSSDNPSDPTLEFTSSGTRLTLKFSELINILNTISDSPIPLQYEPSRGLPVLTVPDNLLAKFNHNERFGGSTMGSGSMPDAPPTNPTPIEPNSNPEILTAPDPAITEPRLPGSSKNVRVTLSCPVGYNRTTIVSVPPNTRAVSDLIDQLTNGARFDPTAINEAIGVTNSMAKQKNSKLPPFIKGLLRYYDGPLTTIDCSNNPYHLEATLIAKSLSSDGTAINYVVRNNATGDIVIFSINKHDMTYLNYLPTVDGAIDHHLAEELKRQDKNMLYHFNLGQSKPEHGTLGLDFNDVVYTPSPTLVALQHSATTAYQGEMREVTIFTSDGHPHTFELPPNLPFIVTQSAVGPDGTIQSYGMVRLIDLQTLHPDGDLNQMLLELYDTIPTTLWIRVPLSNSYSSDDYHPQSSRQRMDPSEALAKLSGSHAIKHIRERHDKRTRLGKNR